MENNNRNNKDNSNSNSNNIEFFYILLKINFLKPKKVIIILLI